MRQYRIELEQPPLLKRMVIAYSPNNACRIVTILFKFNTRQKYSEMIVDKNSLI